MLYQISCVDIKKGDLARFGNTGNSIDKLNQRFTGRFIYVTALKTKR